MSFEFDNLIEETCVPGNEGGTDIDPKTCAETPPVGPSDDPRCADPDFRKSNPDLCAGFPLLILKPELAITQEGGTVQYRTFLRTTGNEYELTSGLNYSSSDIEVAIIESENGLATGVTSGQATISVTWQNLSAQAHIEVVASCSAVGNNILLLIDNSKSSGVGFSSSYSSRLAYAKEAAIRFVETVNFGKDKVAVAYFNEGGVVTKTLSSDQSSVIAAIQAITGTKSKTNLSAGMQIGMSHLNGASGNKVLFLFTDGESNQGGDPELLSDPWKESGKLILVVALRAWGPYFDKLYRIASAGYFLSAYEDTQADVIATLKGIKSFFCSADCVPEAGTYPVAALNYDGFENWNVFQGKVDLVGLGLWDVLPGNGLYVDLAGTKTDFLPPEAVYPGGLESKVSFNLSAGHNYRFKIDVAGNNVGIPNTDPVHVMIFDGDGNLLLDETITPTSSVMDFTAYQFDFSPGSDVSVKIRIEMVKTDFSVVNCGPLIDDIVFTDLTDDSVLLSDNFDNENEVSIQPNYYSYYGPCLDNPPGPQSADPEPPLVAE